MSELRSTYEYTARDLFAGPPEQYMYSRFGGSGFLAAYVDDRRRHLTRFDIAATRVPSPEDDNLMLPSSDSQGDVDTEPLLRILAFTALRGQGGVEFDYWVDVVVRRFEISKRLRRRYTSALRLSDGTPVSIDSYVFGAFAIAVSAQRRSSLRLLNCLLKINDHLCAQPDLPGDLAWWMTEALKIELSLVGVVADRMRVTLSSPGIARETRNRARLTKAAGCEGEFVND